MYSPGNAFNHIMTRITKGLVNTWTIHEEEEEEEEESLVSLSPGSLLSVCCSVLYIMFVSRGMRVTSNVIL